MLREGIRVLSQALRETEVVGLIGAERHERTGERTAYRYGSRLRTWDTRMSSASSRTASPGHGLPGVVDERGETFASSRTA